jgi:TATA-binding protein-associated factor Taf7
MGTVYTLLVNDSRYSSMQGQIAGVFAKADLAMSRAVKHWEAVKRDDDAPLVFTSFDSDDTGLDFHVAYGRRHDSDSSTVTYSVNGFHVQDKEQE